MVTVLESFDIESPEHGRAFKIDLAEGMDPAHIDFIEHRWEPLLHRQRELALLKFFQLPKASQIQARWAEVLGGFGAQDAQWEWRAKCAVATGTNRQAFCLLNGNDVEAAMILLFGKQSRDGTARSIVYVDYVAVAPWNRGEIQSPQRFRHLGTVLIGAAVARSVSLGSEGRCGLHSLPKAEGFYRRLGMTDLGIDLAKSPLRYFEFTSELAMQFIKKGAE